jgi:hypothetical protein
MRDAGRAVGSLAAIAFLFLASGVAVIPVAAASTRAASMVHPALSVPSGTTVNSTNWAGYAITASSGAVSQVSGKWVEPTVKCGSATTLAAFWVGIDGYTSKTVEQDGTLAECYQGTASYYVWWELYPLNAIQIWGTITAGDHLSASVTYVGGQYNMTVSDTTAHATWSHAGTQSMTTRVNAECIAEAPTSGGSVTALADFKKVTFTTCTATVSGASGGIGSFSGLVKINMVNSAGTKTIASTGAIASNTKFAVTWH